MRLPKSLQNYGASKADEPASADSEEPADEVDSQPTEASLSKLKKAELIAIAEDMGVATTGTKSDLVAAILGA